MKVVDDLEEARAFAITGLTFLDDPNRSLEDAIAQAAQAAELRRDATQCIWLRMQLADIPRERLPAVPANLLRIWEKVRTDFGLDAQAARAARIEANRMYSESRALPTEPGIVFDSSIEEMESLIRRADELPLGHELRERIDQVRGVHGKIKEQVRAYLTYLTLI